MMRFHTSQIKWEAYSWPPYLSNIPFPHYVHRPGISLTNDWSHFSLLSFGFLRGWPKLKRLIIFIWWIAILTEKKVFCYEFSPVARWGDWFLIQVHSFVWRVFSEDTHVRGYCFSFRVVEMEESSESWNPLGEASKRRILRWNKNWILTSRFCLLVTTNNVVNLPFELKLD